MSDEMPVERLAEISARVNVATEGPWVDDGGYRVRRPDGECITEGKHCDAFNSNDSAFIAHARADVPDLVAEVQRLQKIEKAARWFAIAAMDRDAPAEVGPQVVADLLEAFGVTVPQ